MSLGLDRVSPNAEQYARAHAHARELLPSTMPELPRYHGVVVVVLANQRALGQAGSDPVRLRRELESFLWVVNPLRQPPAPGPRKRR